MLVKVLRRSGYRATALSLIIAAITLSVQAEPVNPTPAEALKMLKDGNVRFASGKSVHPNSHIERRLKAGRKNQRDYAFATIISCSDSRVPVEMLFDAGIMELFVIRVAGNVCNTDEAGSIEYGLAHVKTPVLVFLGHTQCGAVAAMTAHIQGRGAPLQRNIPLLVASIKPAVETAMKKHPKATGNKIIPFATEQNIWQGIEDLFMASPYSRNAFKSAKVKIVGAMYDVGSGKIKWLPESKTTEILKKVESNPKRAMNVMSK